MSTGALLPVSGFAEEHGAPPAEHGAPEGEGKGEKEEAGGFIKKDEYLELNSAVEQLNAKVKAKKEDLKKLLVEKDHVKEPLALKEITKKVEKEYREINEMLESIEKKRTVIRFRFPEKSFVRNKENSKVQKIEEISAEATVENSVNKLLNLVEGQYQQPIRPAAEREKPQRLPASENTHEQPREQQQNPEDFSKSLLLKK